jgi:DNA-binding transcriptional LysR family regulator
MLNPYELQVFLAAAEAENFSEAARKLHLTQPAVSQQIQTLELTTGHFL